MEVYFTKTISSTGNKKNSYLFQLFQWNLAWKWHLVFDSSNNIVIINIIIIIITLYYYDNNIINNNLWD